MSKRTIVAWGASCLIGITLFIFLQTGATKLLYATPFFFIFPLALIRREKGRAALLLPVFIVAITSPLYGLILFVTVYAELPLWRDFMFGSRLTLLAVTVLSTWASIITYAFRRSVVVLVWVAISLAALSFITSVLFFRSN